MKDFAFYNLSEDQFKKLTASEKRDFVEHLASIGREPKEWEFKYLSDESIEEYLGNKLRTTAWMEDYEFNLLTKEQKKSYIQKKKYLTPAEVKRLDKEMQRFFIDTLVSGNLSLSAEAFYTLSDSNKKNYVKDRMKYSSPTNLSAYEVKFLDSKDQKEFVDYHIENSIEIKQAVLDKLKPGALSSYKKKDAIRECVRGVIKDLIKEEGGI